jgi:hypothetical protein
MRLSDGSVVKNELLVGKKAIFVVKKSILVVKMKL